MLCLDIWFLFRFHYIRLHNKQMMHYSYRVLLRVLCGFGVYILLHKNLSYATHTGVFEADKGKDEQFSKEKIRLI